MRRSKKRQQVKSTPLAVIQEESWFEMNSEDEERDMKELEERERKRKIDR